MMTLYDDCFLTFLFVLFYNFVQSHAMTRTVSHAHALHSFYAILYSLVFVIFCAFCTKYTYGCKFNYISVLDA